MARTLKRPQSYSATSCFYTGFFCSMMHCYVSETRCCVSVYINSSVHVRSLLCHCVYVCVSTSQASCSPSANSFYSFISPFLTFKVHLCFINVYHTSVWSLVQPKHVIPTQFAFVKVKCAQLCFMPAGAHDTV